MPRGRLRRGAEFYTIRGVAARILWRDAQGKEGSLVLGTGEAMIGRSPDCAVRTDDAMVSRNHARVTWTGQGYLIEDLGSANGIYVHEQRQVRHSLRHGDAVRCGSLWLRFVDDAGGARPLTASRPMPAAPSVEKSAPTTPRAPTQNQPRVVASSENDEEARRLRRRIDQLQAELRVYRGGGERADRMEQLEAELQDITTQRDVLKNKLDELEKVLATESGDAKVKRAGKIQRQASELVASLNDVLSNLRINIMAAQGELEQFASELPRASFELIREALRSSADDMESAREMMRSLRDLAG